MRRLDDFDELKKVIVPGEKLKQTTNFIRLCLISCEMYQMVDLTNTVRIPPEYIGEDLDQATNQIVKATFEGKIDKGTGLIVVTKDVKRIGEGRIIHGDGAVYQEVQFKALIFKPLLHEVIDGLICEISDFGAFCHIGPLDALIHKSQIMDDHILIDIENKRFTGKKTKQSLGLGDKILARIIAISLNEANPRESKIGLTMRQPALGKQEWLIKEDKQEKKEKKPVTGIRTEKGVK